MGELAPPPDLSLLETTDRPQRTIKSPSVIYGLGLHSGGRTGMVIQPLPPDTGTTSVEGVWAGGDAAKGPRTLIDAVAEIEPEHVRTGGCLEAGGGGRE